MSSFYGNTIIIKDSETGERTRRPRRMIHRSFPLISHESDLLTLSRKSAVVLQLLSHSDYNYF